MEAAAEGLPQQTYVPPEVAAEQQARLNELMSQQKQQPAAQQQAAIDGVNVAIHSDGGDSDADVMQVAEDMLKGDEGVLRAGMQAPEPSIACPEVVMV